MGNKNPLKSASHQLKPVVIIGEKGLTESVHNEINQCLITHELIKIRINEPDKQQRMELITEILEHNDATMVNKIGHVVVIYRKNEDDND
jgi:RNA-binding protein